MSAAAGEPDSTVEAGIRHILRLFELRDRRSARHVIDTLLRSSALPDSFRSLLSALSSYADRDTAGAVARLAETTQKYPRNRFGHYCLAELRVQQGQVGAAIDSIERALQIDPGMAEAWQLYGSLALDAREFAVAMRSFLESIRLDIDNSRYWQRLNYWLPRMRTEGGLAAEREQLLIALRRQKVEYHVVDQVIYAVLRDSANVRQLRAMADDGTLTAEIVSGSAIRLLEDDFLLLVLGTVTLLDAGYVRFLNALRRSLLGIVTSQALRAEYRDSVTRFLAALSIYALATEFVLHVTAEESRMVAICADRLRDAPADDADRPLLTALVACYASLADSPEAVVLQALDSPGNRFEEYREMVQLHVQEPARIREFQSRVKSFSAISNDVSVAVRQQYEENPYPRWRSIGETQPDTFDNRIAHRLPHLRDDQQPRIQSLPDESLDILVAGCGTGRHALWCGLQYPGTRVLAVDLSSASLAYASMKADELGIRNMDFLQGDLLELPALGRQFDVIESIGVLHHLEDPGRGLAALARCLRAGGWMKVALYSHLARGAVRLARQRIAEQGIPATTEGIRDFRHRIMSDMSDPLHAACERWRDFYTVSDCRDLLFHVQEHQFTTAGLEEIIVASGLEFMGFETDGRISPGSAGMITDWQSLRQWGEFETANPDFFASMYIMWLRKPPGQDHARARTG